MKILKKPAHLVFDTDFPEIVHRYEGEHSDVVTPLHHINSEQDWNFLKAHFAPESPIFEGFAKSYYYALERPRKRPHIAGAYRKQENHAHYFVGYFTEDSFVNSKGEPSVFIQDTDSGEASFFAAKHFDDYRNANAHLADYLVIHNYFIEHF